MSQTHVQDVKAFHDKFGLETPPQFTFLPDDLHAFRTGFFEEELKEYLDAHEQRDLETAADSLVDIIYIVSGAALLHGIESDEFYDRLGDPLPPSLSFFPILPVLTDCYPDFLPQPTFELYRDVMRLAIDRYNEAHATKYEQGTRSALYAMYRATRWCADVMGIDTPCWVELWRDVQRANMSKVRALKASDSKRGSQWDVVKPAGWVPPDGATILRKYGANL